MEILCPILVDPNAVSLSQAIDIADVFLNRLQVAENPTVRQGDLQFGEELLFAPVT